MSVNCELCGTAARECMRVPHTDSSGNMIQDQVYCTDCWVRWKNSRAALDEENERCMTCPHCHKPLADDEAIYMKVNPTPYTVLVGKRPFCVSSETTLANFKRRVDTESHTFDLAVDDIILDSYYLGVASDTVIEVVPRRIQQIRLQIFPRLKEYPLSVYATSIWVELKTAIIEHGDPVLFDPRTVKEFEDNRTISSYPDLDIIAVLPRHLYTQLRSQ